MTAPCTIYRICALEYMWNNRQIKEIHGRIYREHYAQRIVYATPTLTISGGSCFPNK